MDAIDYERSWMAVNWSLVKQNLIVSNSFEKKEPVKFECQQQILMIYRFVRMYIDMFIDMYVDVYIDIYIHIFIGMYIDI